MSTSTRAARTQIRQGDVLLTPIPQPQRRKRAVDANGRPLAGVRVEGERTGHAHELAGRVYEVGKKRVVFGATHRDHPPGASSHRGPRRLVGGPHPAGVRADPADQPT
jgi:hypothetical protein